MTTRAITDQQVAALPIHGGRAELLEEIMSTPVDQVDHVDHSPEGRTPRRRARTWTAVAAAAAVVATVGALAAWRVPDGAPAGHTTFADGSGDTAAPHRTGPATSQPTSGAFASPAPSVPGGRYVALNQPGWEVTSLFDDPSGFDLFYGQGAAELDITTYPASQYSSYVDDREADLGSPVPLTVLGRAAGLWTYAADDHEILRAAEGDWFIGIRATGMSEDAFRAALSDMVQTDAAGFARSLPSGVVTPDNRERAIRHLLRGVDTPPGFTPADVKLSGFNDAYQSAAQVAGSVGCAWIDVWDGGSPADRQAALDAFEGSRSWPLLREIADQGGYSSGFWSIADQLRRRHDDKGRPLDAGALRSAVCS
jgi:hypothetical protein